MILPENYFEEIIGQFENDDELGIASGNCFLDISGKKKVEKVESDHTRGGLKTYKRDCFIDIGGIIEVDGWDGIDNLIARSNGWKTKNFPEILVEHKRATGSLESGLSKFLSSGRKSFIMGYYWPYLIAKSFSAMLKTPYFRGLFILVEHNLYPRRDAIDSRQEGEEIRT